MNCRLTIRCLCLCNISPTIRSRNIWGRKKLLCAVIGIQTCVCKAIAQNMYNIKYINAQQAKTIHNFKNIKEKLLKTNAAI